MVGERWPERQQRGVMVGPRAPAAVMLVVVASIGRSSASKASAKSLIVLTAGGPGRRGAGPSPLFEEMPFDSEGLPPLEALSGLGVRG
jgi:hypothetical protein